jgi:Protein of unknown function (DUF2550)
MLIALLAILGVELGVIVVLLAVTLSRRRWVARRPGAFKGAIRVTHGSVPGLKTKWQGGYGRWVRDILVWTRAPLLFRNELILVDALTGTPRPAGAKEVRRLGKQPVIVPLSVDDGGQIEVAAPADKEQLVLRL